MTDEACNNCRFWDGEGDKLGACRRYAPIRDGADDLGKFPMMFGEEWCGEYENAEMVILVELEN